MLRVINMTTLEQQIEPCRSQYGPAMIDEFLDYWEETVFSGKNKGKAKWQLQPTWEINRRLRTWARRIGKWDYDKSQKFLLKQVDETPVHREPVTEQVETGFQSTASLFSKYKV